MSLNGVDVSHVQRGIDMENLPADFAIMKATQGTWCLISCCDDQYQAAKRSGKKLGVYHYAEGTSVQAEADYFLSNIAGYIGEAMIILDWESYNNESFNNPQWAIDWCNYVHNKIGIKPVLYMSGSVASDYNWSGAVAGDYGLWEAFYTGDDYCGYQPGCRTYGGEFTSPMMLQYSSRGRLSGYGGDLDMDVFYGDRDTWDAYCGASSGNTITPVEPAKTPAEQCPQVDGGNALVKNGQLHSANFTGNTITADGVPGPETKEQKVRVLQRALNADYAAGLDEDGKFGNLTKTALRGHYVMEGETQFMVTAVEILFLMNGVDPKGVECPGSFGTGCGDATLAWESAHGLYQDRIAGFDVFSTLVEA